MARYVVVEQIGDEAFQVGADHDTWPDALRRLADLTASRDEDVDAFINQADDADADAL